MARGRRGHTTAGGAPAHTDALACYEAAVAAEEARAPMLFGVAGGGWNASGRRSALMRIASDWMWEALSHGDRDAARAIRDATGRRVRIALGVPYPHEAVTSATWDALERVAQLRPYAGVLLSLLLYERVRGATPVSSSNRVVDIAAEMDRRLPDVLGDAPLLLDAYATLAGELWGDGSTPDPGMNPLGGASARRAMERSVTSTEELRRLVRLALREAARLDHGTPVLCSLSVETPEQLVKIAHFLAARPGYVGVQAARSWRRGTPDGRVVRTFPLYASVRASLVLDGRPFALEVALPLGSVPGRGEARLITRVRGALRDGGGGDIDVATESGLRACAEGVWDATRIDQHARAAFPLDLETRRETHRWIGHERCAHPRARWSQHTSGYAYWLVCPDCHRDPVAVVPLHQFPDPAFTAAREPIDEERYVRLMRVRAVLEGRDPQLVPGTLDELRRQDGIRSREARDYAIRPPVPSAPTTPRGQSAEQALTGRRRVRH